MCWCGLTQRRSRVDCGGWRARWVRDSAVRVLVCCCISLVNARRTCICLATFDASSSEKPAALIACGTFRNEADNLYDAAFPPSSLSHYPLYTYSRLIFWRVPRYLFDCCHDIQYLTPVREIIFCMTRTQRWVLLVSLFGLKWRTTDVSTPK